MALIRVHLLPPNTKFQIPTFPSKPYLNMHTPSKFQISCSNTNNINDLELALDLATEIEKINNRMIQTKEAMKKSRQLLYAELCEYLGLGTEEVKRKWEKMDEDDKWVIVKEFVSDWGDNFHPLSAKSVKELVDEHLVDDNSFPDSSPPFLFRGLKKIMGFPIKN